MLIHIVKPGESLWSIAAQYAINPVSTAVKNIADENNLSNNLYIYPGQRLIIPLENLYYIVKPGDSLWLISKNFNIPVPLIMSYNNIQNPNALNVGMTIRFPKNSVNSSINPGQYLICIDPGHQKVPDLGKEPVSPGSTIMKTKVSAGAQGVATGKPEYQLNLEVSLKIRDILKLIGFNVLMTRVTNDVNLSNIERAQMANNANADLCVRIHADSSVNSAENGISVLYPSKDSPNISAQKYEKSKMLAEFILNNLIQATGANSKGAVPRTDLTGFNWSKIPVSLVEMGFLSNPREDVLMSSSSYQYKIASGTIDGIEEYLVGQKNRQKSMGKQFYYC